MWWVGGGGGGGVPHQRAWVCIRCVYIYESISHHVRARRVMGVAAEPGVSHVLPFWHRCFQKLKRANEHTLFRTIIRVRVGRGRAWGRQGGGCQAAAGGGGGGVLNKASRYVQIGVIRRIAPRPGETHAGGEAASSLTPPSVPGVYRGARALRQIVRLSLAIVWRWGGGGGAGVEGFRMGGGGAGGGAK